ncbi:phage tail sheath family protein [Streptomyces sp. NRRL S-646]|uniref:phage tail sheath family protein n=1 Tax=Streptomyces sp. NRRL S-646 TaxID=1463917 RepID=UPI001F401327|nr:phage tail sheath subtilisin-like domain-containing protein [Streptomyces sp. NRRL S-646]
MVTPSYPGVYVAETAGGVRPLDVASTSTAAFVGLAERGPDEATLVTSWTQFQRNYGSFIGEGYLAHSVFQYFNNGGRQCYVVRVARADAALASVTVVNRADTPTAGVTFTARSKGVWGNSLLLQIQDGTLEPGREFRLRIRRQRDPGTVPEALDTLPLLEDFDNLSVDPASPRFAATVLADGSALLDAALDAADVALARGRQTAGGPPSLPLNDKLNIRISLDDDGFQTIQLPAAAGAATATADQVAAAIQTAVRALTKKHQSTPDAAFSGFTCAVESTRLVLRSGTTSATSSVRIQPAAQKDATMLLKLGSSGGGQSQDGIGVRRPAVADAIQVGDAVTGGVVGAAAPGGDGTSPITDALFTDAFARLDTVTDASLLAVPGVSGAALTSQGMSYCANRPLQDMFFIGETFSHDDAREEAENFRKSLTVANSYGALYFPWVKAIDPAGASNSPVLLPPSGYVAGLYARIDASRGVWKAPAGTEASLNGTVGLAVELSDVEHGTLNLIGVNVIRRFPTAGVVAFGARTVSADPAWRYVPVRRTAIMLRTSIYQGIQWAVFEPNDEPLWSQLRLSIGAFMMTLFRRQAFQGATPSEAFFVKCDGESTTQADIDAGIVNVLVGFAPLKPAEFVVVRISQQAGLAAG